MAPAACAETAWAAALISVLAPFQRKVWTRQEPGKDVFYTIRNRHADNCEPFRSMCGPDWEVRHMWHEFRFL